MSFSYFTNDLSVGKHFKNFDYDFRPETGKLQTCWNGVKIITQTTAKRSALGTVIGGVGGGLVGGVISVIEKNPTPLFQGIRTGCLIGGGGAVEGLVEGSVKTYFYVSDLNFLESQSRDSAEKTKLIFNVLMEQIAEGFNEQYSIFCPISSEIFSFPVKTPCNHLFDYPGIRNHIERKIQQNLEPDCPLCRRNIKLHQLEYCPEVDLRVAQTVRTFFDYLSDVMNRDSSLSKGKKYILFGSEEFYNIKNDLISYKLVRNVAKKIRENGSLSTQNENEVVDSIKQGTLNEKDAYLITMLLNKSVQNFQNKIETIFNKNTEQLLEMKNKKEISNEVYAQESSKLNAWYQHVSTKK